MITRPAQKLQQPPIRQRHQGWTISAFYNIGLYPEPLSRAQQTSSQTLHPASGTAEPGIVVSPCMSPVICSPTAPTLALSPRCIWSTPTTAVYSPFRAIQQSQSQHCKHRHIDQTATISRFRSTSTWDDEEHTDGQENWVEGYPSDQ